MRDAFRAIGALMKPGAPFALIVGHNHRRDIDTPSHLKGLAVSVGWKIEEAVELQTYQRYGLHSANAVAIDGDRSTADGRNILHAVADTPE
jgi:hypothetical protein